MARPTTIVALVQMLAVVAGFLGLGFVLKGFGYPNNLDVAWNPLAVFLREHGGWFTLMPVLWVFYASAAQRKDCGWPSYRIAFFVGIGVTLLILASFITAVADPISHVSVIERR